MAPVFSKIADASNLTTVKAVNFQEVCLQSCFKKSGTLTLIWRDEKEGPCIRSVVFSQSEAAMLSALKEGICYDILNVSIKETPATYRQDHLLPYDLVFKKGQLDVNASAKQRPELYSTHKISDLACRIGQVIDLNAVYVLSVGEIKEVVTDAATQRKGLVRELTGTDDSAAQIKISVWGTVANGTFEPHEVIRVKQGKVAMRSDGAIYIKSAAAVEKAAAEDASPVKDWYRESGATISPLKVTYAVQRKRVAADELPLLRASDPEVEAILTPMRAEIKHVRVCGMKVNGEQCWNPASRVLGKFKCATHGDIAECDVVEKLVVDFEVVGVPGLTLGIWDNVLQKLFPNVENMDTVDEKEITAVLDVYSYVCAIKKRTDGILTVMDIKRNDPDSANPFRSDSVPGTTGSVSLSKVPKFKV